MMYEKMISELELAYIRLHNHATYPDAKHDMCLVGLLIAGEIERQKKDERERQKNIK